MPNCPRARKQMQWHQRRHRYRCQHSTALLNASQSPCLRKGPRMGQSCTLPAFSLAATSPDIGNTLATTIPDSRYKDIGNTLSALCIAVMHHNAACDATLTSWARARHGLTLHDGVNEFPNWLRFKRFPTYVLLNSILPFRPTPHAPRPHATGKHQQRPAETKLSPI